MQHASSVRSVPPRKALRDGQRRVVEEVLARGTGTLPVQLPTGYGKTLTAAASFRALWERGDVNRLLYLVSTVVQVRQFCEDGNHDFLDAGMHGVTPFDIGYSPASALKNHRQNKKIVFAATIQAVASGAVGIALREMMETGVWMVVVDEYHHYGVDNSWGKEALKLGARFVLAMSATPERKNQDSAFGVPQIRVKYREALKQKAAKMLRLHSYEYKVDAITVNGEVVSFTTSDVVREAGGSDPDAIDKFIIDRKLRWSPKYISPLVSIPIERLLGRRRGLPLQMIVGAMSCLHAQMVCEQMRTMFGDLLRIDWVGTGPQGRPDHENEAVLKKFCPPKVNGERRPEDVGLDILVHVGMAGEGLDSVFVSEVTHLNRASITNQNDQENGRASRRIPGAPDELQLAYINVDSSSPYAEWSGKKIMDVFDRENGEAPPDDDDENDGDDQDDRDVSELPDEPTIMIADCTLQNIDKGDPEVKGCAEALAQAGNYDPQIMTDLNHPIWDDALRLRRLELEQRSRGQDKMSTLCQLRETIGSAVGRIASVTVRMGSTLRPQSSAIGDMCKRIRRKMKIDFAALEKSTGAIELADEAGLRARYNWLKALDVTVRKEGIPHWLR